MNSESNVQKSNIVYRQGGWQAGGRKGRWSINRFQWKGVLPSMSKSIHMVCYLHSCSWSSLSFACSPLAAEAAKFKWGHQNQILRHFNCRLSKRAFQKLHQFKTLILTIKMTYDMASVSSFELNGLNRQGCACSPAHECSCSTLWNPRNPTEENLMDF